MNKNLKGSRDPNKSKETSSKLAVSLIIQSYGRLAGKLASWLAGWLIDEMQVNFNFLKFIIRSFFILFAVFNQVIALLEQ